MALKNDYRVKEFSPPLVSIVLHAVDHRFSNGDECVSLERAAENATDLIANALAEIMEIEAELYDVTEVDTAQTEGLNFGNIHWAIVRRKDEKDVYYIYVFPSPLEMKQYLSMLGDIEVENSRLRSLDDLEDITRQILHKVL